MSSVKFQSSNSLAPTAMLPYFLSLGLHTLMAVSLSLKPQQGMDLAFNGSSFNAIAHAQISGSGTSLPPVSVQPSSSLTSNRSGLVTGSYQCDGETFGFPSIESCRDAYGWIRSGTTVQRYGDRAALGALDVPLPYRYSSSA